jgi:signal peptidase I
MNIRSLIQSPRLRRLARQLVVATALAIPLQVFAVAPYRVTGPSVTPEIPDGSHLLVWRIAPTFVPGDIAAYRSGSPTFLGRVTAVSATDLTGPRANVPAFSIPRTEIIGRVVLTTR